MSLILLTIHFRRHSDVHHESEQALLVGWSSTVNQSTYQLKMVDGLRRAASLCAVKTVSPEHNYSDKKSHLKRYCMLFPSATLWLFCGLLSFPPFLLTTLSLYPRTVYVHCVMHESHPFWNLMYPHISHSFWNLSIINVIHGYAMLPGPEDSDHSRMGILL